MPRFVLLYHDCPPNYPRPSHWDLMLEAGDTLRTWALEQLPRDWHAVQLLTSKRVFHIVLAVAESNEVAAEELGDHRRDYLEYEGEVSDNRGRVIRVGRRNLSNRFRNAQSVAAHACRRRIYLGRSRLIGRNEIRTPLEAGRVRPPTNVATACGLPASLPFGRFSTLPPRDFQP